MTTPRPTLVTLALALAAGAAHADPTDTEREAIGAVVVGAPDGGSIRLDFDAADTEAFASGEAARARVVKGAPFCAEAVRETIQPLTDGNRIVRRSTTRLCRDGEGRTRQEVERGGRKEVWLRDPVARETWRLDPERKTARKSLSLSALTGGADAGAMRPWSQEWSQRMREFAQRMREWARDMSRWQGSPGTAPAPTPPVPATPALPGAAPAFVTENEVVTRDPQGRETRDVRVQVMRIDRDSVGPPGELAGIPMPPAVSWRAQTFAPRGPGVTTALSAKEIEGVRANGERTTWTIEAGKIGNEKPIQITREVWTSPELMVTLATTDSDPRSGTTTYRLTQIKRGEPDAALMRVPADYAVTRLPPLPSWAPAAPVVPAVPAKP